MALYLSLLGPPQLWQEGKPVSSLPRKAVAMAAYLAVSGQAVERARLADLLWEGAEEAVRRNLRQELFRLKNTAWERIFEQSPQHIGLGPVETDLEAFLACMAKGAWSEALALWRGGFLAGLDPKASESYWDWLIPERERWERLYREAMLGLARSQEAAGQFAEALKVYQKLLAEDPLQETEQQAVMRLFLQMGDRSAALRQYEQYRVLLRDQLGLEPSPETQAFGAQLREGQPLPLQQPGVAQLLSEPPLVGRGEDWAWLEAHWGRGLLLLLADAGVGKSRLALEYAKHQVGAGPSETLRIRQRESGQGIGFSGLLEALRQALEAQKLGNLEPAWRDELAQLLPELGLPPTNPHKARFFEALCRALQAVVRPGGVVQWDDLHWLDWASLEFLPYLVRRAGSLGFFLLGTARPEALQKNQSVRLILQEIAREDRLFQRLLQPLDAPALVQLLRQMSGQREGGQRFAERLFQATEGNMFYVLEILRYLFDQGLLRAEAGAWHTPFDSFTSDYRELPLPVSVREVVWRRLEHLGAAPRRLLEAASLAGDGFGLEALRGATALSEWESLEALEQALATDLLRPWDQGYAFSHDLLRRSVREGLSLERRQLLHRKLAQSLERQGDSPARIAEHWEEGGKPREAIPWRIRAAEAQCGSMPTPRPWNSTRKPCPTGQRAGWPSRFSANGPGSGKTWTSAPPGPRPCRPCSTWPTNCKRPPCRPRPGWAGPSITCSAGATGRL